MFSRLFLIITLICAVQFSLSCGENDRQIINGYTYELRDNYLSMGLEFSEDIALNTELSIPVKNYGYVELYPANDSRGFFLGFRLNMDILEDDEILDLEKTRNLPNGQPMSRYVTRDLIRHRIQASDEIATSLYLGPDQDHIFIGLALELSFMDEDFPKDLVISQRIRDEQGRVVCVIALYGPRIENGSLVNPGGLFVVSNVSDFIERGLEKETLSVHAPKGNRLVPDHVFEINKPYKRYYSKKSRLGKLFYRFIKKGKKNGMID